MDKLFFGFLLIFVNFNLNLNGHTLNIFPDWAGYCLIYAGLNDLTEEGEHFPLAKPWCLGMAVYTGVLWLLEIFMGDTKLGIIGWVLGLAATLVSFYVSYLVIQGIADIERNRGVSLGQDGLMKVWKLYVICALAAQALVILAPLALICLIVAFVAAVIFLIRFNSTRRAYNLIAGA